MGEIAPRLGVEINSLQAPKKRCIDQSVLQPRNLVVRFGNDQLDQSDDLVAALQARSADATEFKRLAGDYLTLRQACVTLPGRRRSTPTAGGATSAVDDLLGRMGQRLEPMLRCHQPNHNNQAA